MLSLGNNVSLYSDPEEGLFFLAVEGEKAFRLVSGNKTFLATTGREHDELVGKLVEDFLPKERSTQMIEACVKAIQQKTALRWEEDFECGSEPRIKSVGIMPIFNGEGQCIHLLGTTHDITKRRRTEAALKDETRILELLNETGKNLGSTLDLQTLLQSVTDAATQLTGAKFGAFFYNAVDAQGDTLLLYTLSGAPREMFEKLGRPRATPLLDPTFNRRDIVRIDDVLADPRYGQGSRARPGMPAGHLPVRSYLAVPVVSRSGETIGGLIFGHPEVGVFTERTERIVVGVAAQAAIAIDNARLYEASQKAAQEREDLLQRERSARAEAERLNTAKDEFLAMLAHELRNPLAPISNAAELLRDLTSPEPVVQQASERIARQVTHMSRIMDDLLDVSRVTRGLVALSKEVIDFKNVIAGALDQAHPLIEEHRHQVTVQTPYHAAYLEGDHTRLVQAVANVLNNAVKYTPDGGNIDLTLSVGGDKLQFRVKDNGSGMPEDLVPEVFDLFTQGKRTLGRSQGGLGLGLTLVKTLVELHGGSVTAKSEGIGQGSEFQLELPLLPSKLGQRPAPTPGIKEAPRVPTKTTALTIMVIDDNADAADTTAELLRNSGHQVFVEYAGEAALKRAATDSADVFLVDIGLPDMDGYELLQRLRALSTTEKSIFVAVTGYGQPKDRERTAAAGFSHHLVKPAKSSALKALLADVQPLLGRAETA